MRTCGREDSGVVSQRPLREIDYAKEYLALMRAGEKAGLLKYGPFDPAKDTRVLTVEAQEEVRDIGVYLAFLQRKHPALYEEAMRVRRQAFKLYIALRQLETEERRLIETDTAQVAVSHRG